jgi:hypothetical protein
VDTTPTETVRMYAADEGLAAVEPELRQLAGQVDRATYAAWPPSDEHAEQAWQCSDHVVTELRRTRKPAQRLFMQLDPRPLRRDQATAGAKVAP